LTTSLALQRLIPSKLIEKGSELKAPKSVVITPGVAVERSVPGRMDGAG
jgi:hypothetical protein